MSDRDRLNGFLSTDPRDVGCDEAMAVLHIYVDLTVDGEDAGGALPGGGDAPAGLRAVRRGLGKACWRLSPATEAGDVGGSAGTVRAR